LDEIFQQPMDRFLSMFHRDSSLNPIKLSIPFIVPAPPEIGLIQYNNESLQQELVPLIEIGSLKSSASSLNSPG
jgi:hypothetical protein